MTSGALELKPIGWVESPLVDPALAPKQRDEGSRSAPASADRPNPIGLHRVEIVSVEGTRILVRNLEALNGTPIVDVKPVLDRVLDT